MHILCLQGSPRKKGNTRDLVSMFADQARNLGASVDIIHAPALDIKPCKELIVCEKKGYCPIKDDMDQVYAAIKRADLIVLASPVFFYNVTAQLKALIDRCQVFWGRKYSLGLKEPNAGIRRGFLLSCGGSGGKKLFDGMELTAKIFFDALSVSYQGMLGYRHIESPGDMAAHPGVREDVAKAVETLCRPVLSRQRVLFVSLKDACRSQMAAAFLRHMDQGLYHVTTAGTDPAPRIFEPAVDVMAEKQLDIKFLTPSSLPQETSSFDRVVRLGKDGDLPASLSSAAMETWDVPALGNPSLEQLRQVRDDLQKRVQHVFW